MNEYLPPSLRQPDVSRFSLQVDRVAKFSIEAVRFPENDDGRNRWTGSPSLRLQTAQSSGQISYRYEARRSVLVTTNKLVLPSLSSPLDALLARRFHRRAHASGAAHRRLLK